MADETPFDLAEHPSGTSQFKRGAKPSPPHKLLSTPAFSPPVVAAPAQFAIVPTKLSMWDNDNDGDCVTAQEAFAKAVWSLMCGLPELFIPDQEVIRWASKYGFLNGATLTEVMDTMAKDGFTVGGVNYKDGPYAGVDYSNEAVLNSAIATGPVNIAIDANALPSGAGNNMGWYAIKGGRWPNTDHCVGLSAYGRADFLYDAMKISLPSQLSASMLGRLLFTWNTMGFVTQEWLMGTTTEAFVRNPTTPGQTPGPQPGPGPGPGPAPAGNVLSLATALQAGQYIIGAAPDATAVLNAINALLAACGQPSIPPMAMPSGAVPWVVLVQIFVLVREFVAHPTTASALVLVNAILALFGKPPLTSLGSLYQKN